MCHTWQSLRLNDAGFGESTAEQLTGRDEGSADDMQAYSLTCPEKQEPKLQGAVGT